MSKNYDEMMALLNPAFRDSPDFQEFARVSARFHDKLQEDIQNVLMNVFIDDATWGLSIMEKEFVIPVDESRPLEHRRAELKARKRGMGMLTRMKLRSVLDAFDKRIEFVEDIPGQTVTFYFNGDLLQKREQVPIVHFGEFRRTLRKLLPAHLAMILSGKIYDQVVLTDKSYTFHVPYPITNTFTTAEMAGKVVDEAAAVQDKSYTFDVPYPITNTFTTDKMAGTGVKDKLGTPAVATERSFVIHYPITGEFLTGE